MMKIKKLRRVPALILSAALAAGLITMPRIASAAVSDGITLSLHIVIPSLFPFFVLSSLIISSGIADGIGRAAAPVMTPLFGVGGAFAPALVLGLLGGYPLGAKTVSETYSSGGGDRQDAERALAFCSNTGPAFILGAVGSGVFDSIGAGALLYMIHALSAVITGLIMRSPRRTTSHAPLKERTLKPFAEIFIESVRSSFASILNVCAFVIFFSVVTQLLSACGIVGSAARFLEHIGVGRSVSLPLVSGFIELTGGIASLPSSVQALPAASFLLAWGGLCVHTQALSFISAAELSPRRYFIGKALQSVLAAALTFVFAPLFPVAVSAFSGDFLYAGARCVSVFSAVILALTVFFLLIREKRVEKIAKRHYNHDINRSEVTK